MSEEIQNSGVYEGEVAAPEATEESHALNEQSQEGNTVPLSALKSERAHRQQLQEELKIIKDHLSLLQTSQRASSQKEEKKDELDGLEDSDVLTVGEAKKALQKLSQSYQMSIEELKMTQKHPDYQEVITKYLPEVLKTNPSLRRSLEISQDYELAYHLAKSSDSYRKDYSTKKRNSDAERIIENSQKTGSLSSAGQVTPISQAKRYRDMSDKEFMEMVNKNLGYA